MCNWIARALSGIAEEELNWCSCTCLYPESLLLLLLLLSSSLPVSLFVSSFIGFILAIHRETSFVFLRSAVVYSRVSKCNLAVGSSLFGYYLDKYINLHVITHTYTYG